MVPEEFKNKMKILQNEEDFEFSHGEADDLLVELILNSPIGELPDIKEGIEIYQNLTKYYA